MIFKKILTTVAACSFLFAGCTSKPEGPNAERGTDYTYDFVSFIDITAYGANGDGVIQVTPREYDATDFQNEKDYIKIKKAMDTLNIVYIPGESNEGTGIALSQKSSLSNGDTVVIGISDSAKKKITDDYGVSLNLENYEYVVSDLTEGEELDLFADDAVTFYALEGTKAVKAYVREGNTSLPVELAEHITYGITATDTNFKANSTIINVSASMDKEFLLNSEKPYYNIGVYLRKNGYKCNITAETVLDQVVGPMTFNESTKSDVKRALDKELIGKSVLLYGGGYSVDEICNVQQNVTASGDAAYEYVVTAYVSKDGDRQPASCYVTMVKLNDDVLILNTSDFNSAKTDHLNGAIDARYDVLAQYHYDQPVVEEPAQEEVQTEAESE